MQILPERILPEKWAPHQAPLIFPKHFLQQVIKETVPSWVCAQGMGTNLGELDTVCLEETVCSSAVS